MATEAGEVESMEAPTKTWRKRGGRILLTGDINGSEGGGDEDEAKLEGGNVVIGVCGDDD